MEISVGAEGESTKHFRTDVEGLRALAVLAVLGFHFQWARCFQGGFVGVDIFFVISGYLITRNLIGDNQRHKFSFRNFYFRRVRRLFPALFVTIGATLMAGMVLAPPEDLKNLAASAIASAFSVANIYFWQDSGYFDAAAIQKPLLHIWSLSVEEQFYLVWPALLFLSFRFQRQRRLLILLLLMIGLGLSAAEFEIRKDPSAAFFLTPFRVNEFALGALCALLPPLMISRLGRELLSFAGLVLIVISVSQFTDSTLFPGLSSMVPCVGAALLIYANGGVVANWTLGNPVAAYIGRISYSLYLVHWPIVVFVFQARGENVDGYDKLLMSAGALVLAIGMYRFVEQPFREGSRIKHERMPDARFAKILVTLIVGVLCAAGAVIVGQGWSWRYSANAINIASQAEGEKQARFAELKKRCEGDRCIAATNNVNVFVYGDSHAPDIYNALVGIHPEYNYVYLATAGCPPLARQDYGLLRATSAISAKCSALNEQRLYNDQLRNADIIVINVLFDWYRPKNLENAINQLRKMTAAPIVVFGNYLVFSDDLPGIVIKHDRVVMDSYYQGLLSKNTFAYDAELEALAQRLKFTFISKRKAFCRGDSVLDCPIEFDGKLFTYDKHHLSVAAAAALGDILRKRYGSLFSLTHGAVVNPVASSSADSAGSPMSLASSAVENRLLWLEPHDLSACEKNAVVDVNWNLKTLAPASKAEILVRHKSGKWAVFAIVQRIGHKETGPWMAAGTVLVMRDRANSAEIARVMAGSSPCTQLR